MTATDDSSGSREQNVVQGQFGANARRQKNRRSSLCANGHHKWLVDKAQQFDVAKGKLVTVYRCSRCGAQKNKLL